MTNRATADDPVSAYIHPDTAAQRPDIGMEPEFPKRKPAQTYRYDSSIAPEMQWDDSPDRALAEFLINLMAEAAERGEAAVFPQVWKGTGERYESIRKCAVHLRLLSRPFLNWTGKAEQQAVTVPTLPLFVHERHSTQAILQSLTEHRARGTTCDLFGGAGLDISDQFDAYEHQGPWTNRLILGDSLQVMNSLLEYEGMAGQVQMLYFDPPYGVKFGSNFQPFIRKNRVKHGDDAELSREPEMVRAYRDTWELGLHSYLTFLRDRFRLARELLSDTGSIFVQISDDNIHHVRQVLDEVFPDGFVSQISFQTTSGFQSRTLSSVGDFLLWYARDKSRVRYNKIFVPQPIEPGQGNATKLLLPDGSCRGVTTAEKRGEAKIPEGARFYKPDNIEANGTSPAQPFEYQGKTYRPNPNQHWKANKPMGMERLAAAGRIDVLKNSIQYRRFADDFPFQRLGNIWTDTTTGGFIEEKTYVVQTSTKVVTRCIHMTTNPGDLVLDITCGSGTTAVTAEHWGRRWITVDTSRVPIALARQRLLTRVFPWYRLANPAKGPGGGFIYERKQNKHGVETGGLVPRITLRSIANDEPPDMEIIPERAEINKKVTRVCGPFTVESIIPAPQAPDTGAPVTADTPRQYLDRMIEVLRQSGTLRLPGNITLELDNLHPLTDGDYLHAECDDQTTAIAFGPEHGAWGGDLVLNTHSAARQQGYARLYLFGFAIEAEARQTLAKLKLPTTYVAVTPDVVMSDLLKTTHNSDIFSVTGLPDVTLEPAAPAADGTPQYRVNVHGLDVFHPETMELDAIDAADLPCWMLDTDYNGMVFYATQVFFPKTSAWDKMQRSLKACFAPDVWSHLSGTVSDPFRLGQHRRIAVKAIDERGNEIMTTRTAEDAR